MESIKFLIQGSGAEPYDVEFYMIDGILSGTCTCAAGEQGISCKHRLGLLIGDISALVSINERDLNSLSAWFRGSDIESKLTEIKALEKELETHKKKINDAKKQLSRLLNRYIMGELDDFIFNELSERAAKIVPSNEQKFLPVLSDFKKSWTALADLIFVLEKFLISWVPILEYTVIESIHYSEYGLDEKVISNLNKI